MIRLLNLFFILSLSNSLIGQPICNSYLYLGDTLQYKACKIVEDIDSKYYQFTKEFQEKYTEALKICPYFAWGYREKSVAYLKSGDFVEWKKLIDLAVKYDTLGNLGYRAWCRFQFFRDYIGTIKDIELLEKLNKSDIGLGVNGDYHLLTTKAMCYSAIGKESLAISTFNSIINSDANKMGLYGYYQLGVTYFKAGSFDEAIKSFMKQIEVNEIAEAHYYLGQIFKCQNASKKYEVQKKAALELFTKGRHLYDPYTFHLNSVYYNKILEE